MGTRDRHGRIRLWSGPGHRLWSGIGGDADRPVARVLVPEVAVLRNSGAALRRFGLLMAIFLAYPTVDVLRGALTSDDALIITLVALTPVVPYAMYRFIRKYTIRANMLEIRTLFRRIEIDLPNTDSVALMEINQSSGQRGRLVLVVNQDIKITLGDGSSPSFFEPEGLYALAFALQQSPYVGHRDVGQQIQRLAERPSLDSWPE